MKNKVLIKVIVPSLDRDFDVYIPVNELMWKVNRLITKSVFDIVGLPFDLEKDQYIFINKDTGKVYNNNEIIIHTDIRNSTELIMLESFNYSGA